MKLSLDETAAILGCSKPTASRLARGVYERGETDLPERHARLLAVLERAVKESPVLQICQQCPRDDCRGCRLAEI